MPWVHRGMLAILTRQADFLLNFGDEVWQDGTCKWTKKKLSKIVRHFTYPINPEVPDSPRLPIFKVRYDESGRKPIAIDIVLSQFTNVIMPRGSSKTTVINAAILSMALYEEERFVVYISATEGHAVRQLEAIRSELKGNEIIQALWGNLVPSRSDDEKDSEREFELLNSVMFLARGSQGQVRGTSKKAERPTLIVLDDIDDDSKGPVNDEGLEKTKTWVKRNVEPALPRVKGKGRIFSAGTIIHPQCFVYSRLKDPKYTTIKFGAMDPDGDPLWAEYMNKRQFEAEQVSFAKEGKLFEFGLEYASEINLDNKLTFKPEFYNKYRFYTPQEAREAFTAIALACDPALGEDRRNDFCAFGVMGMTPTGLYHNLETQLHKGWTPTQIVDTYFELSIKWGANRWGIETIAFQKALVHLMREQMFRKHHLMSIDEKGIPGQNKNKILRVEGILQKRMAAGLVTFNEPVPTLISQFQTWPHGKKDGPDVLAMCMVLLDPYAGLALDGEGEEKLLAQSTLEPLNWSGGAP